MGLFRFSLFFYLILSTARLFAFGGAIDGTYVQRVGDLRLFRGDSVEILSEKVEIEVQEHVSVVSITYEIYNSGEPQKAICGLPIDYIPGDGYFFPFWNEHRFDSLVGDSKRSDVMRIVDYIHEMNFIHNGAPLSFTESFESEVGALKVYTPYRRIDSVNVSRKWFKSEVQLLRKQTSRLRLYFTIDNTCAKYESSQYWFPRQTPRTFRFKPGPEGFIIDRQKPFVHITLNAPQLDKWHGMEIGGFTEWQHLGKSWMTSLWPGELDEGQEVKVFFDIGNALNVEYFAESLQPEIVKSVNVAGRQLEANEFTALLDGNQRTSLALSNDGSAEQRLEIFFQNGVQLGAIAILNGNHENKNIHRYCGKIGLLELTIKYTDGTYEKDIRKLDIRDFKYRENDELYYEMDLIANLGDPEVLAKGRGRKFLKSVQIEVKDAVPGTYDSFAFMSEIMFYGYKR